ncbi:uncharacterized protein A4U43_C05F14190 [Asparagus officinalis]|uniref:Uncharacterized protein n=1 Tax=Asparagus officinalis TaxID=4686 RepID=A0A5P1ERH9_ASPOF|nr:uncharacterized protein A4U43_C05F14190 [Asparagus officinalis]
MVPLPLSNSLLVVFLWCSIVIFAGAEEISVGNTNSSTSGSLCKEPCDHPMRAPPPPYAIYVAPPPPSAVSQGVLLREGGSGGRHGGSKGGTNAARRLSVEEGRFVVGSRAKDVWGRALFCGVLGPLQRGERRMRCGSGVVVRKGCAGGGG